MRLAVSEQGYASAVEALVSGNELAAQTATRLARRLRGYGGMAGDDSTATDFAASYDEGAAASVEALESMVGAFGALGRMVEASLTNHARADARSTLPGWARAVVGPPTVADRAVGVLLAAPPSSLGADSGGPGGAAGLVLDVLQEVFWPNADTRRVRAAGEAWTAAAQTVGLLEAHCGSALAALDGERSPEIPVASAVIRDVRDRSVDLAAQLEALGAACFEYADHVETKRSELLSLLEDLAKELALGAVVAGGLSLVSGGAAAGVAGSAGAARLAAASSRARGILDSLRVLTAGTAFTMRPIAVTAGEIGARTERINAARVMLMEGRAASAASKAAFESPTAWAERQTKAGGHMARNHIGRSDRDLHRRILNDPDISASSTFPDAPTAHSAVHEVLQRRGPDIAEWLVGSKKSLPLQEELGRVIGRTLRRDGTISEVKGVFLKLVRDPAQPEGFYIRTGFPKELAP